MGRPHRERGNLDIDLGAPASEEDIVETVERWVERASSRGGPWSSRSFGFAVSDPPDVKAARAWRPGHEGMSGAMANALVTSGYHDLDGAFATYIGDPPVAVWVTFAKYASRQVGESIRLLEAWMTITRGGSLSRGISAGRDLLRALGDGDVRAAATEMVFAGLRGALPLRDSWRAPAVLRDALVEANTDIFSRIGLAFHRFLATEAKGEDGRLAIATLVREGRLDDPMGHLARAFARYRVAASLGARSRVCARGDRAVIHALRGLLVADANGLIAVQEQALIQRATIFDHPLVRAVFDRVKPGQMRLPFASHVPVDAFTLLPEGGNWADYATRMGFEEIALEPKVRDAVVVHFDHGARAYVPAIGKTGTILDLFSRYAEGPAGEQLRRGAPRSWSNRARR